MVTQENYEEYIMMYADGELTPAEEAALLAFIATRPELENELAAYNMARFTPDTTMVFADKKALIKPEPAKQIISFPAWRKYSIAAGIAALIFISFFKYLLPGKKQDAITSVKIEQPHIAVPSNVRTPVQKTNAEQPIAIVVKKKSAAVKRTSAKMPATSNIAKLENKQNSSQKDNDRIDVARDWKETINTLQIADAKKLESKPFAAVARVVATIPEIPLADEEVTVKKSFLDNLPIDDLKKKEMNNIVTAIADNLDKSSISVKIEKRKLIVSF